MSKDLFFNNCKNPNRDLSWTYFGNLLAHLEESLNGFKLIKAFSNENLFIEKFKSINNNFISNKVKAYRKADLASPTSEFLGVIAVISVLWYGGSLVFEGKMQSSYFITYIILFSQLIDPLKSLSKSIYDAQKGNSALDRIETIFEAKKTDFILDGKNIKNDLVDSISFNNISFSYKTDKVLNNISFKWIKGHNNHPQNEICDKLAFKASENKPLLVDAGYENNLNKLF